MNVAAGERPRMKLTDDDRTVLRALRDGPADAATLADRLDADADADTDVGRLAERLREMADNDLVEAGSGDQDEDRGAEASVDRPYALTDSGRRLLSTRGGDEARGVDPDDDVDVPAPVADALAAADLRADEVAALRTAVAYLHAGDATAAELAAAVYPEQPAGRDDARTWWADLRDELASLPGVEPPATETDDAEREGTQTETGADAPTWRYVPEGRASGRARSERDGRLVLGKGARKNLRRTIAERDLPPAERATLRAAVQRLFAEGPLSAEELAATRVGDGDGDGAGETTGTWLDALADELAALPGVRRPPDGDGGTWRFGPPDAASVESAGGERTGSAPGETETPGVADGHPDGSEGDDENGDGDGDGDSERDPRTDGGRGVNGAADEDGDGEGEGCPVCDRAVDGRVYVDAGETVLPASRRRTCVRVTPSDRAANGGLTLFYHGRGGDGGGD